MAIWLVRAGANGEFEQSFFNDNRVYITWDNLSKSLQSFSKRDELINYLSSIYPEVGNKALINYASQLWPFAHDMKKDDWVVTPSKFSPTIHIGKITGDYVNDPSQPNPYYHWRDVDWFAKDIPRAAFDQDILYSFGAFMTICRITRNNAEARIKKLAENGWKSMNVDTTLKEAIEDDEVEYDIEINAIDELSRYIIRKYKGHGMARVVNSILKASGYMTYLSPAGPDGGMDILASKGQLGFEQPKICVQVKSSDDPVDRPVLDQLIGVMQNFGADHGLLVSWSGFKSSVVKAIPNQFFRVRLWDQTDIIRELISHYDMLDDEIKAEIPLKKIWVLNLPIGS